VVNGQRVLQSASGIFLDWSKMHHTGNDFYVRQLRDMKGAFDFPINYEITSTNTAELRLACIGGALAS
jgi:hypothetical protein